MNVLRKFNMSQVSQSAQNLLNKLDGLSTRYFQEFMKVHSSKKYDYIVCIEGNDQPYYINPCRTHLNSENIYFLRCNGKSNVTDLIHILENSKNIDYKESLCLGLVDHDYGYDSDNLYPERIYETPTYSYENFYLSERFFTNILESHFNIKEFNDFSDDYKFVINNFKSRLAEYVNIVKDVDLLYRATKISKKKLNENLLNFPSDKITLSHIDISLNEVKIKDGKSISDFFKIDINQCLSPISIVHSSIYYADLSVWELCKIIRGKYLIKFMVEYLKLLINDINDLNNTICFKNRNRLKRDQCVGDQYFYKVHLNFDNTTILSNLAQYADQPACLKSFLCRFRDLKMSQAA